MFCLFLFRSSLCKFSKSQLFTFIFQSGEMMGGVDLTFHLKMEDPANATQMLMQVRKAHAVPMQAGAGTVFFTATVLNAQTLDLILPF